MATLLAHKLVLAASLGVGALDLAWLNFDLAPDVIAREATRSGPAKLSIESVPVGRASASEPAPAVERAPQVSQAASVTMDAPVTAERHDVFFATNVAQLDASARERIAAALERAAPDATFMLSGHADYRGEEGFNRDLSRRRANAVATHLVRLGIDRRHIRVGYAGEASPSSSDELWRDRRVEVHISGGTR